MMEWPKSGLRAAVRALSESEADNRVCQRIAGRIACITTKLKEVKQWQHELDRRYGTELSSRAKAT